MKKRDTRAVIIIATLILAWFPVALLAELGHSPISGEYSFHPIGTIFRFLKMVLETPVLWFKTVNSTTVAFGIFLAFWTPIILLAFEGINAINKRKNTK